MSVPAGYLSREQRREYKKALADACAENCTAMLLASSILAHGEAADLLLEQKDREIARLKAELDSIANAVYPNKESHFTYAVPFIIEEIAKLRTQGADK